MPAHHNIRPVERDCICLERKPDGPHIAACNVAFRVKFFGTWLAVREDFYAAGDRHVLDGHGISMN